MEVYPEVRVISHDPVLSMLGCATLVYEKKMWKMGATTCNRTRHPISTNDFWNVWGVALDWGLHSNCNSWSRGMPTRVRQNSHWKRQHSSLLRSTKPLLRWCTNGWNGVFPRAWLIFVVIRCNQSLFCIFMSCSANNHVSWYHVMSHYIIFVVISLSHYCVPYGQSSILCESTITMFIACVSWAVMRIPHKMAMICQNHQQIGCWTRIS